MGPKNKVAKEGKPETASLQTGATWACCYFFMGRTEAVSSTVYLSVGGFTDFLITSHHITYMMEKYNL